MARISDEEQDLSFVDGECPICTDAITDKLVLECGHSYCSDCIGGWFESQINQGIVNNITCITCRKEISDIYLQEIISDEVYNKYQTFKLNKALETEFIVFYCTNKECKEAVSLDDPKTIQMKCPKCNKSYCFQCKSDWHSNTTCEKYQQWASENKNADTLALELVKKIGKQCPKCNVWIEKNGGCNHMTCKKCKHEFNWDTLTDYRKANVGNTYRVPFNHQQSMRDWAARNKARKLEKMRRDSALPSSSFLYSVNKFDIETERKNNQVKLQINEGNITAVGDLFKTIDKSVLGIITNIMKLKKYLKSASKYIDINETLYQSINNISEYCDSLNKVYSQQKVVANNTLQNYFNKGDKKDDVQTPKELLSKLNITVLNDYTIPELRQICSQFNLSIGGTKETLINRLRQAKREENINAINVEEVKVPVEAPIGAPVRIADMNFHDTTVPKLKALLKERGLKVSGTKQELITKLLAWSKENEPIPPVK